MFNLWASGRAMAQNSNYIYIYLKMFELISHGRGRTLFANIFLNVPKGQQSNSAFEIFELLEIYMILVGKC